MENKTAEEVLLSKIPEEYWHTRYSEINNCSPELIIQAMHTYAQQQSIGFAEWLGNNKWDWSIVNSDYSRVVGKDIEIKQSSDLYQIYSQQKGK